MRTVATWTILVCAALGGCRTGAGRAGEPAPVAAASGAADMGGWSATWVTEGSGRPCVVVALRDYHRRVFSTRFRELLRCSFVDVRFSVPQATADAARPYGIEAAVDDLEATRRALGLDRFVLVGHSIQGSIALAYALRHPEHVLGVVAIGAVPEASPAQRALARDYWEHVASPERKAAYAEAQQAFASAAPGLAPAALLGASVRADAAKRWFDPAFDERPLLEGAPINMALLGQLSGRPFTLFSGDSRVAPPVFLAAGRHDYLSPPTGWEAHRSRFRDLTSVVFEKSGHTPQLEEAGAFDERLAGWLRGL